MAVILHPPGFKSRLVATALSKVGTVELGKNSGPAVRAFQSATDLDVGPWAWCAAFVCWCYQVTALHDAALSKIRPVTASAFGFQDWGRTVGRVIESPSVVLPGDIVVFEFSHVGICVEKCQGGTVRTVDGNTHPDNSKTPEGVWIRSRPLSDVLSVVRLYESTTPQTA